MVARLATTCAVVALFAAAFATTASAQQISPGGPNAQVSEYVAPTIIAGEEGPPGPAGPPGPTGEVGAAGPLAFTGLWILPMLMIGTALVGVALTVRRRRVTQPVAF